MFRIEKERSQITLLPDRLWLSEVRLMTLTTIPLLLDLFINKKCAYENIFFLFNSPCNFKMIIDAQ